MGWGRGSLNLRACSHSWTLPHTAEKWASWASVRYQRCTQGNSFLNSSSNSCTGPAVRAVGSQGMCPWRERAACVHARSFLTSGGKLRRAPCQGFDGGGLHAVRPCTGSLQAYHPLCCW